MGGIAVQCAVGGIGEKATTELSTSFVGLVNCGTFQYGVNSSGIYRLNYGNVDGVTEFEKSFTLATSDYGAANKKRFRFVYVEVEIYGDTTFTLSVRPEKGSWITNTVSVVGAGLKKVRFTVQRTGGAGTYHTVKLASTSQFRVHSMSALIIPLAMGR